MRILIVVTLVLSAAVAGCSRTSGSPTGPSSLQQGVTGALPNPVVSTGTNIDSTGTPGPTTSPGPSPAPSPGPESNPDGLTIVGNGVLTPGHTLQLQVLQRMGDGSTRDVTADADYASDNPAVVTVSDSGEVTGVGPGVTTVTARYGQSSLTLPVVVSPLGNPF